MDKDYLIVEVFEWGPPSIQTTWVMADVEKLMAINPKLHFLVVTLNTDITDITI